MLPWSFGEILEHPAQILAGNTGNREVHSGAIHVAEMAASYRPIFLKRNVLTRHSMKTFPQYSMLCKPCVIQTSSFDCTPLTYKDVTGNVLQLTTI
jgi:hypothetical protein